MDGLTHENIMGGADNPAYDASSGEWNAPHKIGVYYDILPGAAEPDAPPAGKHRVFYVDTGTSPNRRLYHGVKYSDGTVDVIWDYTK